MLIFIFDFSSINLATSINIASPTLWPKKSFTSLKELIFKRQTASKIKLLVCNSSINFALFGKFVRLSVYKSLYNSCLCSISWLISCNIIIEVLLCVKAIFCKEKYFLILLLLTQTLIFLFSHFSNILLSKFVIQPLSFSKISAIFLYLLFISSKDEQLKSLKKWSFEKITFHYQ